METCSFHIQVLTFVGALCFRLCPMKHKDSTEFANRKNTFDNNKSSVIEQNIYKHQHGQLLKQFLDGCLVNLCFQLREGKEIKVRKGYRERTKGEGAYKKEMICH